MSTHNICFLLRNKKTIYLISTLILTYVKHPMLQQRQIIQLSSTCLLLLIPNIFPNIIVEVTINSMMICQSSYEPTFNMSFKEIKLFRAKMYTVTFMQCEIDFPLSVTLNYQCLKYQNATIYSITSMAWTRMARLPWMIRTLFSVPTKSFQ